MSSLKMLKQERGSALRLDHDIGHKPMSRSQYLHLRISNTHNIVPEMGSGEAGCTRQDYLNKFIAYQIHWNLMKLKTT